MRHAVLDRWSRGASGLHRRDPRAKIFCLLVLLIAVATAGASAPELTLCLFVLLLGALVWARIPIAAALTRAAFVFSFTLPLALINSLAGEAGRAGALLCKSYISSLAVVLLVATTPMPMLLSGLESARVPRFLLMVTQFVYRYLFVIGEEAFRMRNAALSRGGPARRVAGFRGAAGAVGALFARSYARAGEIHRAMLARGFNGRLPSLTRPRLTAADALFTILSAGAILLARLAAERLAA